MPSPEHATDLERMLSRAAQECESKRAVWFGGGLPQAVRSMLDALGRSTTEDRAELAFVEVTAVSPQGRGTSDTVLPELECVVVGLSSSTLEDLGSLLGPQRDNGIQITRLICPVAVFDFTPDGIRVREVRHGLTAADLQQKLSVTLWAGADLKELGTH